LVITIPPDDVKAFTMVDTPEETIEMLKDGLTRYHLQPKRGRRSPRRCHSQCGARQYQQQISASAQGICTFFEA
jgi:hypothetical protein